jgi:poly(A) polymerase
MRGVGQGPFHHLDVLAHTLEVARGVERELQEPRLGARVAGERVPGLRLSGVLHDVAKPQTRGEWEGRVIFVSHDTLGAALVHRICRRLGLSALATDLAATLTALHLKIGFMAHDRTDYPQERLVRAAGPFAEELAVLSWADRLAARGPRLKDEHVERHRDLSLRFLNSSRAAAPHPEPDYARVAGRLDLAEPADVGYATSCLRLISSGGTGEDEAVRVLSAVSTFPEA